MSLLQRVLGLIPKKASREERTFFSELLKAVDSNSVNKSDIDSATSSVYDTLNQLGTPIDARGNINVEFPQTPLNFTANGAFNNVILEWDMPTYSGHNFAEIFRADVDDLSVAEANGVWLRSYANVMADSVDSGTTHYYWVRFVNVIGQAGAFNSPTGTAGVTSVPVEQMINELKGRITTTELAQDLATPISQIPSIQSNLSLIELDIIAKYNEQQALIGEAKSLAENGSNQLVNDVLALSNDFADKYQAMRVTLNDIESYVNAVITTDPETGQITLDALTAYEDQFNLSIANINQDIDVLEGKFTLKVWQTDVDAMGNQTLSAVNDEILARSGVCSLTDFTDAASCIASGGVWQLSSLAQEKKALVALSNTAEANAKSYADQQITANAYDDSAIVEKVDGLQASVDDPVTGLGAKASISQLDQAKADATSAAIIDIDEKLTSMDLLNDDGTVNTVSSIVQQSTYSKTEVNEQIGGVLDYIGAGDFDSGEEERLTAEAIMQNALATADEKTERRQTNAAVIRNDEARVTEDEALATSIELLQANLDDASATILNEQAVRATEDEALATQISTVQTSLGDDIASVQVDASAAITKADSAQADANTALVKYGVKLDVNGYVTGFAQNNDGTTGSFYIRADEFAIIDPASNTDATALTAQQKEDATPFAVIGGNTYIKNAYIQDLTADNFVAGKIVADEVKAYDLSAYNGSFGSITGGSLNIGNGNLTIDTSGNLISKNGVIQSANYLQGVLGFRLNSGAEGSKESPNIDGAFINGGEINGAIIRGSSIIFTQQLRATAAGEPFYCYGIPATETLNLPAVSQNSGWTYAFTNPFSYYAYNALPNGLDEPNHFMTKDVTVNVSGGRLYKDVGASEASTGRGVTIDIYTTDNILLVNLFSYYSANNYDSWTVSQNGITVSKQVEMYVSGSYDDGGDIYDYKTTISISGASTFEFSGQDYKKIKIRVGMYSLYPSTVSLPFSASVSTG